MRSMDKDRHTINIKIKNVTVAQAMAIESLLNTWQRLGGLGSSRWTSFFADGDGNFRPEIEFNGRKAQHTHMLGAEEVWEGTSYKIDFDKIAWKLYDDELSNKEYKRFLRIPPIINKIKDIICRKR